MSKVEPHPMHTLDEVLPALTPERLQQIIMQMVDQRPPGERAGVDVNSLVSRLTEECGIDPTPERSRPTPFAAWRTGTRFPIRP